MKKRGEEWERRETGEREERGAAMEGV